MPTPAEGLLSACTSPSLHSARHLSGDWEFRVIHVSPLTGRLAWRGPRAALSGPESEVPILPLPPTLAAARPSRRIVGRAFNRSVLAPRGGVAVPARCRLRGGEEGRCRQSQLLQLYALCLELLAEL